jgi:DNA-binding GntR family transcriptional regulator
MNANDALRLLTRQTLPGVVQDEIEQMILDGRLQPGEALREVALSATLGVSRGPLREAFRGLEEKGLVRTRRNCGVQVRSLSLDEADQIYELRITLEPLIGRKAAARRDAAGLAGLTATVSDMAQAVDAADVARYLGLNVRFHNQLALCTGNAKLHAIYSRLVSELSLFRRQAYLHNAASMRLSMQEHAAILAAVADGQASQAARLLRHHAADSRLRLHQALAPVVPGQVQQQPALPAHPPDAGG